MIKRKQIVLFLVLFPMICLLCSFLSATFDISEPYLAPIPLEFDYVGGYTITCEERIILEYSRHYIVPIPVSDLKNLYQVQMEFFCRDDIVFQSCGTSCYYASCTPRFQIGSLKFANWLWGIHNTEIDFAQISYEIRPFTQNGMTTKTRIHQSQSILATATGSNLECTFPP